MSLHQASTEWRVLIQRAPETDVETEVEILTCRDEVSARVRFENAMGWAKDRSGVSVTLQSRTIPEWEDEEWS